VKENKAEGPLNPEKPGHEDFVPIIPSKNPLAAVSVYSLPSVEKKSDSPYHFEEMRNKKLVSL